MKAYIKFIATDEYKEWQVGDYGIVDGYVCRDGITYAIVIVERTNQFAMVRPFKMEFVKYVNH